jgi:hypothetical protein
MGGRMLGELRSVRSRSCSYLLPPGAAVRSLRSFRFAASTPEARFPLVWLLRRGPSAFAGLRLVSGEITVGGA